jgi:glycosyltransferase involved in cell wall biosynthesis
MGAAGNDRVRRPIRVLRVIARLNVGGPAQHVVWLAAGLRPRGFETLLAAGDTGPDEAPMDDLAERAGVRRVRVPGLGRALRPLDDARALVHLTRLCRTFRPHIVHTHTAKAGVLGRLAASASGVRVRVHTFHGHVLRGYFGPVGSGAALAAERALGALSAAVIALSPRQRHELAHTLRVAPPPRVRVVPLGIDLAPFGAVARARRAAGGAVRDGALRRALGVDPAAPLVGLIGRLVPIKQPALAVEAIARAASAGGRAAHLVVVGDGPERQAVQAAARARGMEGRVHLAGVRRPVAPVYAELDGLLLTSRNEGTPVVILEALAAGVPVVATAVGGVPDLAARAPGALALSPAGDAHSLAAHLSGLLATPGRAASMGAAALAAAPRFGLAQLFDNLERFYRQLLRHAGGCAPGR